MTTPTLTQKKSRNRRHQRCRAIRLARRLCRQITRDRPEKMRRRNKVWWKRSWLRLTTFVSGRCSRPKGMLLLFSLLLWSQRNPVIIVVVVITHLSSAAWSNDSVTLMSCEWRELLNIQAERETERVQERDRENARWKAIHWFWHLSLRYRAGVPTGWIP